MRRRRFSRFSNANAAKRSPQFLDSKRKPRFDLGEADGHRFFTVLHYDEVRPGTSHRASGGSAPSGGVRTRNRRPASGCGQAAQPPCLSTLSSGDKGRPSQAVRVKRSNVSCDGNTAWHRERSAQSRCEDDCKGLSRK